MPAAFVFCGARIARVFFSAGFLFFPDAENREESGGKVSKRYDNLWKKMVDFALKKDACYGTL